METIPEVARRSPVLVTFRCPACKLAQGADLLALSKRGSTACTACQRRLSVQDVSRAIERERKPPGSEPTGRRGARLFA